jgi:ATP-dependent helicase HrpB
MDAPPDEGIAHAKALLQTLGALDAQGGVTPHGAAMLGLGLHPRLAHMLLRARDLGWLYEASLLAALLEEREIYTDTSRFFANITPRLQTLHEGEWRRPGIDAARCAQIVQAAGLLRQKLGDAPRPPQLDTGAVGVLLAFAYPDRIAQRRGPKERRFLLSGGKGAVLHPEDDQISASYLAVADLEGSGTDARIYLAAPLDAGQLHDFFSESIRHETAVTWNKEAKRLEARERTTLGRLVLSERPAALPKGEATANALIEALRSEGADALPWSDQSRALQARVMFLNRQKNAHPALLADLELPDLHDAHLMATLEGWLKPYLDGISGLEGCKKLDLKTILSSLIPWETQQHIEALAPAQITVPSGSKIAIDYSDPDAPVLAVRLQELFGLAATPAILNGAFPLLLHLLSPAHRPMQVTRDLASFWQNSYDEVKKELRGKYKKHYWPDDPRAAQATAKTKKFM